MEGAVAILLKAKVGLSLSAEKDGKDRGLLAETFICYLPWHDARSCTSVDVSTEPGFRSRSRR